MKIGVLCNSKLCLPGLYFLSQQGVQLSLVLPQKNHEDHYEIEQFATFNRTPLVRWNKKEVNTNLPFWVAEHQLDTVWIMTFPFILSKTVIQETKASLFNFHFAPLPKYKGAQPVFWMIKNGETKGGITVHQVTEEVDAGMVLHEQAYSMKPWETFGSYNYNIANENVNVIVAVFNKLNEGNWKTKLKPQEQTKEVNCTRPDFNDVKVDWNSMTAKEIECLCRACNPWNKGAISNFNGKMIKWVELTVFQSKSHEGEEPGTLIFLEETGEFVISTKDHQYLKVGVFSVEEGSFSGYKMRDLGFFPGASFR